MEKVLFDSTAEGMARYFVCPNDDFVLNSLEYLDYDEYLYRLLRRDGYDRVIFIGTTKVSYNFFAYDKLSHLSMRNCEEFRSVDPADPESVASFYEKVKKKMDKNASGLKGLSSGSASAYDKIKEFGRREIFERTANLDKLLSDFQNHISLALSSENIKTAVVMPLENFETLGPSFVRVLRDCENNNRALENIIVFTVMQKDKFQALTRSDLFGTFHSWLPEVLSKTECRTQVVDDIVNNLKEYGSIVLAHSICIDEIANLLLRKKLIEQDARFINLKVGKIYPLAVALQEHLAYKKEVFHSIPYKKRQAFIRQLNACLKNDAVVSELVSYSETLKSKPPRKVEAPSALLVERISHRRIEFIENDEAQEEILAEFERLVGGEMENVKNEILESVNYFEGMQREVQAKELAGKKTSQDDLPYMNMRFVGPPGTGKTTVAKLTARLLHARGILPTDRVESVDATDLVKGHVGETGDLIRKAAEAADGGVLIIDEFYGFDHAYNGGNIAKDAMDAILSVINEYRTSLCVIVCGYEEPVEKVLRFNDGGERRFPHKVHFANYTLDTLMVILDKLLEEDNKTLGDGVRELLRKVISADMGVSGDRFGNVGYLKDKLLGALKKKYFARNGKDNTYTVEDVLNAFPKKRSILTHAEDSVESVLAEFDLLFGGEMAKVKDEVIRSVNYFEGMQRKLRKKELSGKKTSPNDLPYMNMRFLGPPGTGKTTVARLTARLLHAKGILPTDSVEQVDATELVKGYVGETGDKIREAAEVANGGVLIIDEFYGFDHAYNGGNIAKDAMDAILSVINKYRTTLCIIVCGYEEPVEKVLKFNNGGKRRFPHEVHFANYTLDTLMVILDKLLEEDNKTLGDGVRELLRKVIASDKGVLGDQFGNAGYLKEELLGELEKQYFARNGDNNTYTKEDVFNAFPKKRSILTHAEDSVESVLSEFDRLTGNEMENIKREILESVNFFEGMQRELQEKELNGVKVSEDDLPYMNMRFLGPPGTGKTTIAKLTARLLHAKGILPTDRVERVDATELVKGHVGETGDKIREAAEAANGGVLIIDEFYGFDQPYGDGGNIAKDAMDAILSVINRHRTTLCIIVCGYEAPVKRVLSFNDGGDRRFPNEVHFTHYTLDTLMVILDKLLEEDNKTLGDGVRELLRKVIASDMEEKGDQFGNAGYLKDILLAALKKKYFARGATDGVYRLEDVEKAFPAAAKSSKPRYTRIPRRKIEALPIPDTFNSYDGIEEHLRELVKPSILFIQTEEGTGTGFLISPDGYAITCNHVIRGAQNITARLRIPGRIGGSDSDHKCTVVNAKAGVDIALIKLEGKGKDPVFPYLPLAEAGRDPRDGEAFSLSGYPLGEEQDVTTYTGKIANGSGMKDSAGFQFYNIEGEAKKGNSGSPLVSVSDGRVIGLLKGSIVRGHDEMNRMRPIKYFWEEFLR